MVPLFVDYFPGCSAIRLKKLRPNFYLKIRWCIIAKYSNHYFKNHICVIPFLGFFDVFYPQMIFQSFLKLLYLNTISEMYLKILQLFYKNFLNFVDFLFHGYVDKIHIRSHTITSKEKDCLLFFTSRIKE